MTPIINHQFNYIPPPGQINNQPSLTIPDDSMSLEEILRRYMAGLPINGSNQETFYEEEELPDLKTMDLEEIAQLRDEVEEKIDNYRKQQAQLKREEYERSIIERHEKTRREQTPPPGENKNNETSQNEEPQNKIS